MTPTVLYKIFAEILPAYVKSAKSYVKKDERSIIIRLEGGDELIFQYEGPDKWALCTKKFKEGEK